MKRMISIISAFLVAFTLSSGTMTYDVYAEGEADAEVQAVIQQLEAIDSLQEMQNERYTTYKAKYHYDTGTTDTAIINAHETARAGYEAYVSEMFAARLAAQHAYNELSAGQKAQISSELAAKLDNELPTVFNSGTYGVTPRDDEYSFEAVNGGGGYGYEVGNHMIYVPQKEKAEIPQTFILVDTSDGKTEWTPNGKYVYGESNYDVTYCCDAQTPIAEGSDYKRVNLEDSSYYGKESAKHIRAILENSYPYVSVDEMKARLKAGGLDPDFVDSLTRGDMISAVQMAIWTYANAKDGAKESLGYYASVNVTKNQGEYFIALHDHTNECWDWQAGKRTRSYDARAEYRVNNLAHYLCSLPGVEAEEDQVIISDVEVTRAELIEGTNDTYKVGMYVLLNGCFGEGDDLTVTAVSIDENGNVTGRQRQSLDDNTAYEMSVTAKYGDTIKVTVEGTQNHAKGVYFYEPEGGRDSSQCLVGVAEGAVEVNAEQEFVFSTDIKKGLRIYKTATGTKRPVSEITFDIYKVEGTMVAAVPTEEEIAEIMKDRNKVGTVTTDVTGYASLALEDGTYLVAEQHNARKVVAPVEPFYIQVPMSQEVIAADGDASVESIDIVSVYPKNEPTEDPGDVPPPPVTPNQVTGKFSIYKHDAADKNKSLEGAQFQVYAPAVEQGLFTKTFTVDGVEYAVDPVEVDGDKLILTTGENGTAMSPELSCGVYYLEEIKAPAGYYLLDEPVKVTVRSKLVTEYDTVEIANEHGAVLPETGGIGTTIFRIIGGLLIFGAAMMLIVRRRMNA